MTTYIPTATELEELGFQGDRLMVGFMAIRYDEVNGFDILLPGASKYIYPRSLSDLKTLIEIFTPPTL